MVTEAHDPHSLSWKQFLEGMQRVRSDERASALVGQGPGHRGREACRTCVLASRSLPAQNQDIRSQYRGNPSQWKQLIILSRSVILVDVGRGRTPQDRGGGGSGPAYNDCHGNATVLSPGACSPTPRVARRVPLRPGLGAANQWELMSLLLGPRARHTLMPLSPSQPSLAEITACGGPACVLEYTGLGARDDSALRGCGVAVLRCGGWYPRIDTKVSKAREQELMKDMTRFERLGAARSHASGCYHHCHRGAG